MKIKLASATANRTRPKTPTVVLTDEAYDAILEMSNRYNVSMRQLASAIIVQSINDGIMIDRSDS